MVTIEDFKKIDLLQHLSDDALQKILPLAKRLELNHGDVIFKEGEKADTFFLLKRGKVLLEVDISDIISISLGSVKPGFSFGWSALINDSTYTSGAICTEPCEILTVAGKKFQELLKKDHTIGYHIMTGLVHIIRNRLARRTEQFLKVMAKHPDIEKLL